MVIETEKYRQSQAKVPDHIRAITRKKIAMLAANRAHRSLRTHKMTHAGTNVWSCTVARRYRLLYRLAGCGHIFLLELLPHETYNRI